VKHGTSTKRSSETTAEAAALVGGAAFPLAAHVKPAGLHWRVQDAASVLRCESWCGAGWACSEDTARFRNSALRFLLRLGLTIGNPSRFLAFVPFQYRAVCGWPSGAGARAVGQPALGEGWGPGRRAW